MLFESFDVGHSNFLWAAFFLSIFFGAVVNKTNFCTMGAVSDMVNMNDFNRFRAWLLAIAVSIFLVSILEYTGLVDLSDTFPPYRSSQFIWADNLLGGIIFGIGMTLASGCGNKTLVRIGGGNIKSLFVIVALAFPAYYMTTPFPDSDQTLYSFLFYDWINPLAISLDSSQDLGALIGGEDDPALIRLVTGLVVTALLFFYIVRSNDFFHSKDNLIAGVAIGIIIAATWLVSSNIQIEADGEEYSLVDYYEEWDMLSDSDENKPQQGRTLKPRSFTFVNPVGQSIGYTKDGFEFTAVTFGLVSVLGVIVGSFLWAVFTRSFRIEWFVDGRDAAMHIIGGLMMGVGGVLALGCTIGQGITGMSTLAIGSVLTLVAIIYSSAITMKVQYYKIVYEDEASFFKAFLTALVDLKLLPASLRQLDAV